tara:strand:+ start:224 stop:523 length:300 start_codon:yes stop_codon:yes gene_type:complete
MSETKRIDARGLICPLPVIRTQDCVRDLPKGTIIEIIATDIGTKNDIPSWCRIHGHEVLSITEAGAPEPGNLPEGIKDIGENRSTMNYEIRIQIKLNNL